MKCSHPREPRALGVDLPELSIAIGKPELLLPWRSGYGVTSGLIALGEIVAYRMDEGAGSALKS
jgi:hypothetical protein